MDLLYQSALAWKKLTEYNYRLTYGYKKRLHPINLTFSFEDFPHLAGFQYLKDISLPNFTSAKIVDRILEGKISFEQVKKAHLYEEMVRPRLEALIHLKDSLDNEFTLYSFKPPKTVPQNVIFFAVLPLSKVTATMKPIKNVSLF